MQKKEVIIAQNVSTQTIRRGFVEHIHAHTVTNNEQIKKKKKLSEL